MIAEIMMGHEGPSLILRGVIPFGIFVFAGYLFIEGIVPSLRGRIRGLLDIIIVAISLGMSIFTFGFVLLNAGFGVQLSRTNVWISTIALLGALLVAVFKDDGSR
jgi:hypothetical protein